MALKDKLMTLEDFKAVRDVDVASNQAQFTEIKADLDALEPITDDTKEALLDVIKNVEWDSDIGQVVYNNLYEALYGTAPIVAEPEFSYDPATDGVLSDQDYVIRNTINGNATQSLSGNALVLYAKRLSSGSGLAYIVYEFGEYDGVYGRLKFKAKIEAEAYLQDVNPRRSADFRIEVSNSTSGAQFYISRTVNGYVFVRYYTGTTEHTLTTTIEAGQYHDYEIVAEGTTQKLIIDGAEIVSANELSTSYVSKVRFWVMSGAASCDVTLSVKQVEYYEEAGSSKSIITPSGDIKVSGIKKAHPSYNDDQILALAITEAQKIGGTTKIIWDGEDIHFSGIVTHTLKGFGGIDFNGSKIYMPDYDNGTILNIVPELSEDIEVQASDIHATHVTEQRLKNKVFTLNTTVEGNADMCLGDRPGNYGQTIYCSPCLMTMPDGNYTTDGLYMVPSSGTVTAYNVHYQAKDPFEICNGFIYSSTTNKMSVFIYCTRSTTHIHGFKLLNRSQADAYRRGVIIAAQCYGVEIDHIIGVNPADSVNAAGYALGLFSVTRTYIHDIDIGDTNSWGSIGARHYTDVTFERCFMKRWDCHFAQYGHNFVKDCTIRSLGYGKGFGKIIVDGCTFIQYKDEEAIALRADSPGVFDGDIVVKNSVFTYLESVTPSGTHALWHDCHYGAKASNDETDRTPYGTRILDNCIVQSGHKSIFKIGTAESADMHEYDNLTYVIKNMVPVCASVIFESMDSTGSQAVKKVELNNCAIQSNVYLCDTLEDCDVVVDDCDFGSNSIKIKKNIGDVKVSDTKMSAVVVDQASNYLTMTGCTLSGTQSVSNFTAYALSGNIASDMASVNKHSS